MTKKDYTLIAETINKQVKLCEANPNEGHTHVAAHIRVLVAELSRSFMANNPRFDPQTFVKACGF